MLTFSPQQQAAFDKVQDWLQNGTKQQQVFRVFGLAGTGKTTITKKLISGIKGKVISGSYTNKAVSVMRKAGLNAETIHALTYRLEEPSKQYHDRLNKRLKQATDPVVINQIRAEIESNQKLVFSINEDSPIKGAKLLQLDEVSYVNEFVAQDLESFGVPILVLGDPGQLSPIDGEGYYTGTEPDVMLTEIHRQALDNPIIKLADLVRRGRPINFGDYEYNGYTSQVKPMRELTPDDMVNADQILVGKHVSRRKMNRKMRQLLGYSGEMPNVGETLLCMKNNKEKGFTNGLTYKVKSISDEGFRYTAELVSEEGIVSIASMLKEWFKEYQTPGCLAALTYWDKRAYDEFDFGYASTVHKAMGSQWEKVLFWDDRFGARDPIERRRWLYTGLTRAIYQTQVIR